MPEDFEPTDVFNLDKMFGPTASEARRYGLQIGREQTKLLRQIAEQPRSSATSPMTYELAQSVRGLSDGFSGMERGLDRAVGLINELQDNLKAGFAGLGALFDWRMSNIITLLEQQQTTDYEIRDLLKYPRRAQANEDKEDARRAMEVIRKSDGAARSEWLDRALSYFTSAAEKNPFDYTTHLDMGKLLLLWLEKPRDALKHFEEAVRTAQAWGHEEFESKAHFFAGRAHGLMGNHEEAYRETRRALDLQPEAQVVAYECARYSALTGRADECAKHIESLIRTDVIGGKVSLGEAEAWWAKIRSPDLPNCPSSTDAAKSVYENLRREASRVGRGQLEKAEAQLQRYEMVGGIVRQLAGTDFRTHESLDRLKSRVDKCRKMVESNLYSDWVFGIGVSRNLHMDISEAFQRVFVSGLAELERTVAAKKAELESLVSQGEQRILPKVKSLKVSSWVGAAVGGGLGILSLGVYDPHSESGWLVLLPPFLGILLGGSISHWAAVGQVRAIRNTERAAQAAVSSQLSISESALTRLRSEYQGWSLERDKDHA